MVQLLRCRFFAVSAVILLALVVFSDFSPRAGGQEAKGSLILDPQLVNIMQGYVFNVNVTVQDVTNLGWLGAHLDFDTSRISMQTYVFRDGWSGGCASSSPPHEGVYFSGTPTGGSFTGSAVVLTITFRCDGAGFSQISVSSSASWIEAGGAPWHYFAVRQGATVNQAAPVTVTLTMTATVTATVVRPQTFSTTVTHVSTLTIVGLEHVTQTVIVVASTTTSTTLTSPTTITATVTSSTTLSKMSTMTTTATIIQVVSTTETYVPALFRRCIIASAAYGSELAPEVQFLRTHRDMQVQSTFAGAQFTHVFNAFYYSFSSALASAVAESPVLAQVTRTVLYPLVAALHASSVIFQALSFMQESAVVASGILASALIGLAYLTPLLLTLQIADKRREKRN